MLTVRGVEAAELLPTAPSSHLRQLQELLDQEQALHRGPGPLYPHPSITYSLSTSLCLFFSCGFLTQESGLCTCSCSPEEELWADYTLFPTLTVILWGKIYFAFISHDLELNAKEMVQMDAGGWRVEVEVEGMEGCSAFVAASKNFSAAADFKTRRGASSHSGKLIYANAISISLSLFLSAATRFMSRLGFSARGWPDCGWFVLNSVLEKTFTFTIM